MSIAKKCDICGLLYEQYNKGSSPTKVNGVQFLNIGDDSKAYSQGFIDCCPECMGSIKNHINELKTGGKL